MIRRPVPKKPAPVHRVALTDAELLDLATTVEARHAAARAADARMIEAAFAEMDAC